MSGLSEYIKNQKRETGAATIPKDELMNELQRRETSNNPFPLHVFHDSMKPYIEVLVKEYDLPRAFVGLCLLSAYSTAIGTKYVIATNQNSKVMYLPIWACMVGISSSGKSFCLETIYEPLFAIQNKFNTEWEETTGNLSAAEINKELMKTIIYRDSHIPTLIRNVLPDNPKGVCKVSDEILEWINGFNQLSKKEGTDEQFWLSTWSCAPYSAIRSGKQKISLPRPFTNIIGGTQYKLLNKIFANNRDTTGFVFRVLFALPDSDKISESNPHYESKKEQVQLHAMCINALFNTLAVNSAHDAPYKCILSIEAVNIYQKWCKDKVQQINAIEDRNERDTQSSIFGKTKEYALRFCAILHLSDKVLSSVAFEENFIVSFSEHETVSASTMSRSLELADYFFQSATDVYSMVENTNIAPEVVIIASNLFKKGYSKIAIAKIVYPAAVVNKLSYEALGKKIARDLDKWRKEYPAQFGATTKH